MINQQETLPFGCRLVWKSVQYGLIHLLVCSGMGTDGMASDSAMAFGVQYF